MGNEIRSRFLTSHLVAVAGSLVRRGTTPPGTKRPTGYARRPLAEAPKNIHIYRTSNARSPFRSVTSTPRRRRCSATLPVTACTRRGRCVATRTRQRERSAAHRRWTGGGAWCSGMYSRPLFRPRWQRPVAAVEGAAGLLQHATSPTRAPTSADLLNA